MRAASALPSISWAGMRESIRATSRTASDKTTRPRSTLGRCDRRAQRDLQQVRHRVGVELFHDVGAVRLDRLDADAEVVGDLLVQAAGDDALEHLRLAGGQA